MSKKSSLIQTCDNWEDRLYFGWQKTNVVKFNLTLHLHDHFWDYTYKYEIFHFLERQHISCQQSLGFSFTTVFLLTIAALRLCLHSRHRFDVAHIVRGMNKWSVVEINNQALLSKCAKSKGKFNENHFNLAAMGTDAIFKFDSWKLHFT